MGGWSERIMGQKGFFDVERRLEAISGASIAKRRNGWAGAYGSHIARKPVLIANGQAIGAMVA
jgi:hypothetical protein